MQTHQALLLSKLPNFKKQISMFRVYMQPYPKSCFPYAEVLLLFLSPWAADITTNHKVVYKGQAGTIVVCNIGEDSTLKKKKSLLGWKNGSVVLRIFTANLNSIPGAYMIKEPIYTYAYMAHIHCTCTHRHCTCIHRDIHYICTHAYTK